MRWTKKKPTVEGTYFKADRYGRVSVVGVTEQPADERDDVLRTDRGLMVLHPDMAPHYFAGPLKHEDVFPPSIVREIQAAIDRAPQDRVEYCEKVVRDCPRSKKAKADLEEARTALAQARREVGGKGGA